MKPNLRKSPALAALLVAAAAVAASTAQALPGATTLDPPLVADTGEVPEPLRISLEDYVNDLERAVLAPNPISYDGIRPGQLILVTFPNGGGTFICTLSFIFQDTSDTSKYYAGTAGHCLLPPTATATHGPGADYDASDVIVSVCITGCEFGGQLSGLLADMEPLGTVAYARQTNSTSSVFCPAGDIGNDFGLVLIDDFWYDTVSAVDTRMAVWLGPYGSSSGEGTGNVLVHHGNGIVAGTAEPTKSRVALSLNDGILCSFDALGAVHGGDSGSAISFGGLVHDKPYGGEAALGTITHALVGAGTLFSGTVIDRGIQMASDDAGIDIVLCDAMDSVPGTC